MFTTSLENVKIAIQHVQNPVKTSRWCKEFQKGLPHCIKPNAQTDSGLPCLQGSYRQDCVKFKDFSRTSKRLSSCFQGLKT